MSAALLPSISPLRWDSWAVIDTGAREVLFPGQVQEHVQGRCIEPPPHLHGVLLPAGGGLAFPDVLVLAQVLPEAPPGRLLGQRFVES